MAVTRESVLGPVKRPPVAVEVAGDQAFLRHPTFAEWRSIVGRHPTSGPVAAEDAAAAVATLLTDADGKRLFGDDEVGLLLGGDPLVVATLYARAWETVLRVDDERVGAAKGESTVNR